jgi:hypothetical protein
MRVLALPVVCWFALCLAGCYGWDDRYGIKPVIDPASVETSTTNQIRILNALAQDAGLSEGTPEYWYYVAQAGFNYVDDQCTQYFDSIFFLDRSRSEIKSGLTAAGATTAAILGVTGASATSIAIAAQAFGLGVIGTDVVAGTYLYQVPPSTARGFVRELQLGFRKGAAARAQRIDSPTAAYHMIQNYLSLCLPPTIEAQIAKHVADAKVTPDPVTSSSGVSFGLNVTSGGTPPPAPVQPAVTVIKTSTAPLPTPPPAPTPVVNQNRLNPFEQQLTPLQIHVVQAVLCGPTDATGPLGASNSSARNNLYALFKTYTVDPRTMIKLQEMFNAHQTANNCVSAQ